MGRKWRTLFVALSALAGATAQPAGHTHMVGVGLGAGYAASSHAGSRGVPGVPAVAASIGYARFLGDHLGFGGGLEYGGCIDWRTRLGGTRWSFPFEFHWRSPVGSVRLLAGTGLRLDVPSAGGGSSPVRNRSAASVVADIGCSLPLAGQYDLYAGLSGCYGITPLQPVDGGNPFRLGVVGLKVGLLFGWDCRRGAASPMPDGEGGDQPEVALPAAASDCIGTKGCDGDGEAAARAARRDARLTNHPGIARALVSIESDLDEAAQSAAASGSDESVSLVADARARAADARAAHSRGQYGKAYDLFGETYALLAGSYAASAGAAARAAHTSAADKAAADAALYADAARMGDLDGAMAASHNAKLNSDLVRGADTTADASAAVSTQAYAGRFADEALRLAERVASRPAVVDAKDAAGKAYRGRYAACYAAAASAFAKAAAALASKTTSPEATAAAGEAGRHAAEAARAALMGNTVAAHREARAAQQDALRLADAVAPAK